MERGTARREELYETARCYMPDSTYAELRIGNFTSKPWDRTVKEYHPLTTIYEAALNNCFNTICGLLNIPKMFVLEGKLLTTTSVIGI